MDKLYMIGAASMPSQIFAHPINTTIRPHAKGIPTAFQALMA